MFDDYSEPDPLVDRLSHALPHGFVVARRPVVWRRELDAVVVGRRALFVLYAKDWEGIIRPAQNGPWRAGLPSGEEVEHVNPAREVSEASKALTSFLRDEFPALSLDIHHLVVLTNPAATRAAGAESKLPVAPLAAIPDLIAYWEEEGDGEPLDAETQTDLASALRDGRLTPSQRALAPFVFRSSSILRTGRKAWTIRAAVKHVDKHTEDGIHHLRNGTLANWFAEQGAPGLAELARYAMQEHAGDPQAAVETFLIGTGLVQRPKLVVRPARVNVGNILAGDTCGFPLRIGRARRRHYVRCTLKAEEPWLGVEPDIVTGRVMDARVVARTEALPIRSDPYDTSIRLESSVSDESVEVPISLRVVGKLAPLNRYVARPLTGALVGALLGAAVGSGLGLIGFQAPPWLAGIGWTSTSSAATFAILVGLFWAALGGILGYAQPLTWPTFRAVGRWVRRLFIWAVTLSTVAVAGLWASRQLSGQLGLAVSGTTFEGAVFIALAAAMLPAAIREIQIGRREAGGPIGSSVQTHLRPLVVGVVCATLMVLLVAGGRVIGPVWGEQDVRGQVVSARGWIGERWGRLEGGVNDFLDQLFIQRYDRRAPPRPTPTPPAVSGRPAGPGGTD
jgi:hypothetical protein